MASCFADEEETSKIRSIGVNHKSVSDKNKEKA